MALRASAKAKISKLMTYIDNQPRCQRQEHSPTERLDETQRAKNANAADLAEQI